jgi:hypothetical protein
VEGVVLVVGWAVRKVVVLTKLVGLGVKWVVADLKDQLKLNGCLYFCDDRRVTHVKYLCSLVYSDETVLFTNIKLQNDGNRNIMFYIFSQYMTKGPIELNTLLVRSFKLYVQTWSVWGSSKKLRLAWLNLERTKLKRLIYMILSFVCFC